MTNEPLLSYRGTVYPWHCDHMGHMNVMFYVGKFDEATWHLFAALGLTPEYPRQNNRGMAAVEQSIAYRKELRAGTSSAFARGWSRSKTRRFALSTRCERTIPGGGRHHDPDGVASRYCGSQSLLLSRRVAGTGQGADPLGHWPIRPQA